MANSVSSLTKILSSRFPGFADSDAQQVDCDEAAGQESTEMDESNNQVRISGMGEMELSYESDSDGGPVVVPSDEVEASFARSASTKLRPNVPSVPAEYSKQERETYQLLFAAKMEHEDILMACARILDAANDVSLVREAAAYLEEIEANRKFEP